jgi:hypothetical protein
LLPLQASVHDMGLASVVVVLTTPIRLVSEANQREHWATKHRRKEEQQEVLAMMLPLAGRLMRAYAGGVENIVLVRHGRGMDQDNLAGSFKHVQDGIARYLATDDKHIAWTYLQEVGSVYGFEARFVMRRLP